MNFVTQLAIPIIMSISQVKEASANDSETKLLLKTIRTEKWYEQPVKHYEKMKFEFTENDGLLLRENRIFIHAKLRQKVLTVAHQCDLRITKKKLLMREKVYWQGMHKEVENFINECIACQVNTKLPNPTPLSTSELPKGPLVDISCDSLLVITDLYSRFPIVEIMKTTNTATVINIFERLFSIFCYP